MHNSPPGIVEKEDRIPIFKKIPEPISRKAWQSKLKEKDASMASQDSWYVTLPLPLPLELTRETSAICLEPVNEKDNIRPLPCNHIFHLPCFDQWFWKTDQPNRCPLCRAIFVEAKFPELPEQSHVAPGRGDSMDGSDMN